ncbi:MAG TPA: CocE/NonD family hydrolase [Vicinamibacteria bacterium]|nr:CocE/NonD family hydrolase [Vicinamibacteria bacterium]
MRTPGAVGIPLLAALAAVWSLAAVPGREPSPPVYEATMQEAWIPMRDGVRLAADLHVPKPRRSGERFPVLLEYLPYRKAESRSRSHALYSYFVQRGYAVARVDIRGTGNSEGRLIPYEYSEIEQADGEVVIDWLSKQPFSSGKVGMFGISWGGFNSIHMAMRNPPALKAIIAVDATDDLYQDDVHFMDGMMHVDSWEMGQDLRNLMPGAPDYTIDDKYFENRFDTPPWMLTYKRQQRDGPFWKRTALKERYDSIRIPTFMIGGWYDGYRDSIPRMLQHLKAPTKAILGPWHHAYPNNAYPKPQMEWRHEAVRWFDHWLKGRETGIMEEPRFAVFVRDWHRPGPVLEEVAGEWRYEDGWPIARIQERTLHPQPNHTLSEPVPAADVHRLRYVPTVGIEAGGPVMWFGDVAPDQRPTDAFSLVYDTAPLEEDLEVLGLPRAILRVSADAPLAHWFARLSDIAPDGTVTQVAAAGFNGAHRDSAERPAAIEPGREFTLDIELHVTSWVFPKGHRIRLAINNALWPMIWPTPYPFTASLRLGGAEASRLVLPVVPRANRPQPSFLPPAPDPELPGFRTLQDRTVSGYGEIARIERDATRAVTRVFAPNAGATEFPWGTQRYTENIIHEAKDDDPASTSVRGEYAITVALKDRTLAWESEVEIRSDRESFHYSNVRRLLQDGRLLREKVWKDRIPRDHQ